MLHDLLFEIRRHGLLEAFDLLGDLAQLVVQRAHVAFDLLRLLLQRTGETVELGFIAFELADLLAQEQFLELRFHGRQLGLKRLALLLQLPGVTFEIALARFLLAAPLIDQRLQFVVVLFDQQLPHLLGAQVAARFFFLAPAGFFFAAMTFFLFAAQALLFVTALTLFLFAAPAFLFFPPDGLLDLGQPRVGFADLAVDLAAQLRVQLGFDFVLALFEFLQALLQDRPFFQYAFPFLVETHRCLPLTPCAPRRFRRANPPRRNPPRRT